MRTLLLLAVVVLAANTLSCSGETKCEPVNRVPSGDLKSDLVGCWQTYGYSSLIVFQFKEDESFRLVEPPNSYTPSGQELLGVWTLTGDVLDMTASEPVQVEVSETTLTFKGAPSQYLRRVQCTGQGFDRPELRCPP
jgi:hypothetical protein